MRIQELGHVVLYVTNLERVANFYRKTLGFSEIVRESGAAMFSSGRTHHELLLIEIGGEPKKDLRPSPGLYHIGFKVGDSTEELRGVRNELVQAGVRIVGTADHGVTHSLYILDPDGNELELYVDISDAWRTNPKTAFTPTRSLTL